MIAIDDNGNFITDAANHLTSVAVPAQQNFKAEVRCIQDTWAPDPTFGRNVLIWTLSQSPSDRCEDLTRIGLKYMTVNSVIYDEKTQKFSIEGQ